MRPSEIMAKALIGKVGPFWTWPQVVEHYAMGIDAFADQRVRDVLDRLVSPDVVEAGKLAMVACEPESVAEVGDTVSLAVLSAARAFLLK